MKAKIIYLSNITNGLKSPLPSDTLWGNICWAIKWLYGDEDLKIFLDSYMNGTPQLLISSSFPFLKKSNNTTCFFPRPILPHKSFDYILSRNEHKTLSEKIQGMVKRKEQKDIWFLEESYFEKVLAGTADYDELPVFNAPKLFAHSITRNTIDRLRGGTLEINGTGQLFTEDEFFIQGPVNDESTESGLFFLSIDNTGGKLEAALRLLGHIGIGGNRSIGKGSFEFHMEDFEISEPAYANAMLNLSLYIPTKDELSQYLQQPFLFNYHLEQRKGFYGEVINGTYEKHSLTYFKEGSVFPIIHNEKNFYGKNILNKNSGPYLPHRYGFGFMIKMFINEKSYNS